MTVSEQADAKEAEQIRELDKWFIAKSVLYQLGEVDPSVKPVPFGPTVQKPGQLMLMGDDPRLRKMPAAPTLMDFFKYRFGPSMHLLQSANLARKNGCPEKIILACLLHDIANQAFIRADHGYWGAQLLEPYVDEEVSWAIRYHQALRFYPDESVGYPYPDNYVRMFGADYKPDAYIQRDYAYARQHKWYMSARMICVNDLYSFDPN